MAELMQRLSSLRPVVERICKISGATGVSIGVVHGAKVVLTDNFGFRDVEKGIPPNQDTIYYLASLSKSFTAVGMAHLIHQSKDLTWDTPISQAYQPLSHQDPDIREHVTIADFLSHRSGLAPKNHIWSQEYGHFTFRRGEDIRMITYLEKIAELRSRWIYNNWGYAAADELIEHISGMSWGKYLKQHIFDPLLMHRTVTTKQKTDPNVAKAYIALANGDPWEVEDPDGEDGEILEGALAVRSCVSDLLTYYIAFMRALKARHSAKTLDEKGQPFIDAEKLVEPHIQLSTESKDFDGSYGLGWVNVKLPCRLGVIGMNHGYVGKMPVVGKGLEAETTCFYHQGSANSFLSSVHLLPDSESAVVVLTNSMAQNDVADWLGELYLECIMDNPDKNDYIQLAEASAHAALALWPGMREELARDQIPHTSARCLREYVGIYYNQIGNYRIEILEKDDKLLMRFQREKRIVYEMTHYHYDTFSWLLTHDRDVKLGRFPVTRASFYLIAFESCGSHSDQIDSLIWKHDDEVLSGERFFRRDAPYDGEHGESSSYTERTPDPQSPTSVEQLAAQLEAKAKFIPGTNGQELTVAVPSTNSQIKLGS